MKKIFVFIFAIFLAFSLQFVNFSVLATSSSTILYQNNDVKDEKEILKMGLQKKIPVKDTTIDHCVLVKKDGKIVSDYQKIKVFEYTQVLKKVKTSDNIIVTTYITSLIYFDDGEGGGVGVTPPEYDGSQYASDWDGSIGVQASSTIYWNETYDSTRNLHYIDLVKASGGWLIDDIQLSITSQEVELDQSGWYYNGNVFTVFNESITHTTIYGSYVYYAPSDWVPVISEYTHGIRAIMRCTIVRGTGSWEFQFTNTVIYTV